LHWVDVATITLAFASYVLYLNLHHVSYNYNNTDNNTYNTLAFIKLFVSI